MNGRHFVQLTTSPRRPWRPSRMTLTIALAVAGLAIGGVAWLNSRPVAGNRALPVPVTFADLPREERAAPDWPKYLPRTSAVSESTPTGLPSPTVVPTVAYCATQPSATVPATAQIPQPLPPPTASAADRLPPVPTAAPDWTPPAPVAARPAAPLALRAAPLRPVRSQEMEMVARQSDEKIREGIELADRGAYFAARADCIAALRMIAQGLDNDEATSLHSQALGDALTAMKEAQDFLPASGKVESELDLPAIVAGHRTPLLKDLPAERLHAMSALKQYFNFAQERLHTAAGHEVSGSMALGALGKIHVAMSDKMNPEVVLSEPKAVVFLQAALLVCPRNYIAANDLGVLLAHKNDYAGARAALEHSVTVCRTAENTRNLSVVYRRLGETRLADLAARDSESVRVNELARQKTANRLAGGAVVWVDADTLAKSSGRWSDYPARPSAAAAQTPATANAAAGQGPTPFAPPAMR